MIWNLLDAAASSPVAEATFGQKLVSLIPFLLIIGAAVVMMIFSRKSQKKREDEINSTLDAIQPGNKVKTIGGICGVVVEICPEDNTFVLETGSEKSGKSYIKFDKKAVYQTDAVAPSMQEAPVEETPVEENPEEAPFEEVAEVEAPVEETETKEE